MHLFGITFYGVFASGELQPWAEPPNQEQTVWSPSKTGYTAETTFVSIVIIKENSKFLDSNASKRTYLEFSMLNYEQ